MSYKIQTSKFKAFLIQDAVPILVVLFGLVSGMLMTFVNIKYAGESCGINALDTCSVAKGYIIFLPITLFLLVILLLMFRNIARIGTIHKVNLQYRDFSGIAVTSNKDSIETTIENIVVTAKSSDVGAKLSPKTDFKLFDGVLGWTRNIVVIQLVSATMLGFLNITSGTALLIVGVAIPLLVTSLNISLLRLKTEISSAALLVFLWKNPVNGADNAIDAYRYQSMLAKKQLILIGLLFIFLITGFFISIVSAVISKSIYG